MGATAMAISEATFYLRSAACVLAHLQCRGCPRVAIDSAAVVHSMSHSIKDAIRWLDVRIGPGFFY
jgi:hypothetical protein